MNGDIMNNYVIVAGADGTGKSSLRGVLEGQNVLLGHIIDADAIAKEYNFDNIKAGKKAIEEINYCLARCKMKLNILKKNEVHSGPLC